MIVIDGDVLMWGLVCGFDGDFWYMVEVMCSVYEVVLVGVQLVTKLIE